MTSMSSRSTAVRARAAKTASRKRSSKAISDKAVVTPAASVSAAALRLAAEGERGLAAGSVDVLSPPAGPAVVGAPCHGLSAPDRGRPTIRSAQTTKRSADSGHGDRERDPEVRKSRRVRARHVAELDRTLSKEATHGPRFRSRPAGNG